MNKKYSTRYRLLSFIYVRLILTFLFIIGNFLFSYSQVSKTDSLIQSLNADMVDSAKVKIYNKICLELWQAGKNEEAIKYAEDALNLAETIEEDGKLGWSRGIADAYKNFGAIYSRTGNFNKALESHKSSMKILAEMRDEIGISSAYLNIGGIEYYLGNYPEALKNFFASLKISERLGNKINISNVYVNIGAVYSQQENYSDALENIREALTIKKEIGDMQGAGACHNNMGIIYEKQKKYNEAIISYDSALRIYEEYGNRTGEAQTLNNIGNVHQALGNFPEAQKNFLASLKIKEETRDKKGITVCYNNLGSLYTKQGDFRTAIRYLEKGLVLSEETGSKDDRKEQYTYLAEAYAGMKDYRNAFRYHQLYSSLKDSILNEESAKETAKLKTLYESEKKDYEIEMLHKDKLLKQSEIERQTNAKNIYLGAGLAVLIISVLVFYIYRGNRIRRENEEKFRLEQVASKLQLEAADAKEAALKARMSDHFITNTITSINQFLETNDAKSAGKYLLLFHSLIRKVLVNSEKKQITLKEDLEILDEYIQLEMLRFERGKLDFRVNMDETIDPSTTFIPPMVFQVLVENSIKHGLTKEKGGIVTLIVMKKNNHVICAVEDNGMGRAAADDLKSSHEERISFGTDLAERLIKVFHGMQRGLSGLRIIDLIDAGNNPKGTRVEFSIPYLSD